MRVVLVALMCVLTGCRSARPTTHPTTSPTNSGTDAKSQATTRASSIDVAVARGVEFLVKDQQPDGFWGTGLETRGLEIYSMVPGSHDAFRVGTTALCIMALRQV